jgi:hypothetical protein
METNEKIKGAGVRGARVIEARGEFYRWNCSCLYLLRVVLRVVTSTLKLSDRVMLKGMMFGGATRKLGPVKDVIKHSWW